MQSSQRIDLVAVQGPSTTNMFTGTLRLVIKPKLLFPGQDRALQGPAEPKKRPLADAGQCAGGIQHCYIVVTRTWYDTK